MAGAEHANPLAIGGIFVLEGDEYAVDSYIDLNHLVARQSGSKQRVRLEIADVIRAIQTPLGPADEVASSATEQISDEDWKVTEDRGTKLQLLLEAEHPTRELAKEVAKALGKNVATIYRWRIKFKKGGIAALAPHHPDGGRGKARLDDIAEDIIQTVIDEEFLTQQKLAPSKLMPSIEARCRRANVPPPHENTVRARIQARSDKERATAREGGKGRERHTARPGRYDGAQYPNAVWQVDHTPLDLCIVDDVYRLNIGRAWLTLIIDVFSRCVVGFYLSLDKPNETSVGMALVHAILPKEGWLLARGIQAKWPIWGKPITVHADNDKTFRCEMVTRAAKANNINLEWRAVKTPHWGAHIERLLGTLNRELHTLPGTTFSNPQHRGEYKPHDEAEFSFDESEQYLTTYICGTYHQQKHSGIGQRPPIRKYESGILGDAHHVGTGLPAPIKDPDRLRLDFLPFKDVTVQRYGIVWDTVTYYDPVLDPWILARDPADPKRRRKFVVRRDPRDISFVWFLNPDTDTYFRIPYRRIEHPSINLWELRAVRAHLREQGREEVDEDVLFETYDELQRIRKSASDRTQTARKEAQKKRTYEKKRAAEAAQVAAAKTRPARPDAPAPPPGPAPSASLASLLLLDDDDIQPFGVG